MPVNAAIFATKAASLLPHAREPSIPILIDINCGFVKIRNVKRFIALFCLLLITADVHAATQGISSIKEAVHDFVAAQTSNLPGEVSIEVGELDSRLTLPACGKLEPFLAEGSRLWGNSTIGVKCEGMWTIYVPVKIRVMASIVVSARPLSQGMVISPSDIMLRKADLSASPPGVLTDTGKAVGKTLNSSIPSGYPVTAGMLRAPLVIMQGQSVKLVSKGAGFQVTSQGVALGAAAEGQTVQVRTPSGHIISGIARAGPYVEVEF